MESSNSENSHIFYHFTVLLCVCVYVCTDNDANPLSLQSHSLEYRAVTCHIIYIINFTHHMNRRPVVDSCYYYIKVQCELDMWSALSKYKVLNTIRVPGVMYSSFKWAVRFIIIFYFSDNVRDCLQRRKFSQNKLPGLKWLDDAQRKFYRRCHCFIFIISLSLSMKQPI